MLATPARIAGCQQVVLCSPPPIADEILYAAQLCGVKTIFNVGGARGHRRPRPRYRVGAEGG